MLAWVREALHASHADERREHEDAIHRLQAEYKRLGDRINAMYVDKLDGKIDAAFFDRMAGNGARSRTLPARDRTAPRPPNSPIWTRACTEMLGLFGEMEDSLDRTWDIAQRCQVHLEKIKEPFPKFDVPTEHSTDTYFEFVARQGFEQRRTRLEALRTPDD